MNKPKMSQPKGILLEAHQMLQAVEKMTGSKASAQEGEPAHRRLRRLLDLVPASRLPTSVTNIAWHTHRIPVTGAIAVGRGPWMKELAQWCNEEVPWLVVSESGHDNIIDSLFLIRHVPTGSHYNASTAVASFANRTQPVYALANETTEGVYIAAPLARFLSP